MIGDRYFKIILIPVLGVFIPVLSQLFNYNGKGFPEIIVSNLIFITISFIIWNGSLRIVVPVRNHPFLKKNIYFKLVILCFLTATYSFLVIVSTTLFWQWMFLGHFIYRPVLVAGFICVGVVICLTLLYETLFLNEEREIQHNTANQLDQKLEQAKINALKSDLDPHFLFNSLTALLGLINDENEKARAFLYKLSQVYKYFLLNKNKETITLDEELSFTEDYFYLLSIRFDHKIILEKEISINTKEILILPFALQNLVENAIKHNQFDEAHPLIISIFNTSAHINVSNFIRPKVNLSGSTGVGLTNLKQLFNYLFKVDIVIEKTREQFIVRIPLIRKK